MSDSCSAITPFEIVLEDNFVALGSSSFGEKSISHGFDSEINSAKSDDFTFYVSEWLTAKDHKSTIKDLYQYLDFTKLKVHSKLIGNSARKQANIDHYVKR